MSTHDFFRARLDTMIDLRHPLAVLATRLPWAAIEAALAPKFAHQDRCRPSGFAVRTCWAPTTSSSAAASARPAARACRSA